MQVAAVLTIWPHSESSERSLLPIHSQHRNINGSKVVKVPPIRFLPTSTPAPLLPTFNHLPYTLARSTSHLATTLKHLPSSYPHPQHSIMGSQFSKLPSGFQPGVDSWYGVVCTNFHFVPHFRDPEIQDVSTTIFNTFDLQAD